MAVAMPAAEGWRHDQQPTSTAVDTPSRRFVKEPVSFRWVQLRVGRVASLRLEGPQDFILNGIRFSCGQHNTGRTPSIEPENCHSRVFRVTSQLLCAFAPMLQFGLTLTCLATKCHEVRSRVGLGRCNKVGPSPPANLRLCHPGQQVPMLRRDHWAFNAVRDKRVHPREQERPEET